MSTDTDRPNRIARSPFDLSKLWRNNALDIDNGTVQASHLKATVLRTCASQLESVLGDDLPFGEVVDASVPAGLIELHQLPIGSIVTNYFARQRSGEVVAWVLRLDRIDGLRYWQGSQSGGVSVTTDKLVRDHGPQFERLR